MKFADRLQETTTATSAATVTLTGAPSGFRTLASVIAAGEMSVGEASIPFYFKDDAGNWEAGLYTIASATQLTRERIIGSSNNGAAVLFTAGTKVVFNNVPAMLLAAGLVDPTDAGYDIIVLAGQSNMCGRGASDADVDVADARIMQWNGPSAKIMIGCDPLYHGEGPSTGMVGPGPYIARAYLSQVPPNRRVLLVPCGVGGSGLAGGSMTWQSGSPGGNGYENTITKANAALAAARAHFPNSRVVGIAWHQGETDADSNISQAAHVAALKATIAGFRSRITGASNAWVVIGQMCPEVISASSNLVKYTAIDNAHKQVAAEVARVAYAAGPTGQKLDSWHYTAEGSRRLGSAMGLAVRKAIAATGSDTTAPAFVSGLVAHGAGTTVRVTMSEVPAGGAPDASAFALSGGRTVTAVALSGNDIVLTASPAYTYGDVVTVTYTKPSANQLQDAFGNQTDSFGPSPVSNTIQQNDTTAPTASSALLAAGAPSTIVITMSEPLAAITPDASAFAASGRTVTGVVVNGSTVSLAVHTPYTSADAITASYTKPGTNVLQDASGNETASFGPLAVVNNVPSASATFATWNPADAATGITLTNGNLSSTGTTGWKSTRANVSKNSGKWYWEVTVGAAPLIAGVGLASASLTAFAGSNALSWGYYSTGQRYFNNSGAALTNGAYVAGDVIGFALDMDAKTIQFYKNGVAIGTAYTLKSGTSTDSPALTTEQVFPMLSMNNSNATADFGATPFAYTPPTGFVGLTA